MNAARTQYSLDEIGEAINYWLAHEQAEPLSIGPHARVLADIYGTMLYTRAHEVQATELTAKQAEALTIALHQLPLL
jgi:hypothetical protein